MNRKHKKLQRHMRSWALALPLLIGVASNMALSSVSAQGGLVGPVLCCSPVLPVTMSFIAGIFPALVSPSAWALQGLITTHQIELFATSTLLLVFAFWQNARRIEAAPNCKVLPRGES